MPTDGNQGSNHRGQPGNSNDRLCINGRPMTNAKDKRMKEVLIGLIYLGQVLCATPIGQLRGVTKA